MVVTTACSATPPTDRTISTCTTHSNNCPTLTLARGIMGAVLICVYLVPCLELIPRLTCTRTPGAQFLTCAPVQTSSTSTLGITRPALLIVRRVNTTVVVMIRSVSLGSGSVMESEIVPMVRTSQCLVRRDSAEPARSSVITGTVLPRPRYVTASMIVEMGRTRSTVISRVRTSSSSVPVTAGVYLTRGNVTESRTVKMVVTRIRLCVITGRVTRTPSSPVVTATAYPNCGCVTLTTTVGMIATSLPTCAARRTVLRDGRDVRARRITDVFRSGCSATARMTVETAVMSCRRTVPSVMRRQTSSARTTGVFPNVGCATSRMIVATNQTKQRSCVAATTGNVARVSSSVRNMANVYRTNGDVITMKTVQMEVMR
uniref:Uncharacterized protein n=1 Tax=Cacopsylla melanoneura TaxID=428564 RepID=A0A8D8ZVZ7_9HEMI